MAEWTDILGIRRFVTVENIIRFANSDGSSVPDVSGKHQDLSQLDGALLIFQTSKQRTWLVSGKRSVVCVLDDLRKPDPVVLWRTSAEAVLKAIQERRIEPATLASWRLMLPEEHQVYLSKSLFPTVAAITGTVGQVVGQFLQAKDQTGVTASPIDSNPKPAKNG